MVAVLGSGVSPPEQRGNVPALRRLVAVAVAPATLRPGSPLAALLNRAGRADLLLLTDGEEVEEDGGEHGEGADPGPRLRALADAMDVPGLALHRLALSAPIRPRHVEDVVAALSELIGFDPEPGVGCARPTGDGPADLVVGRAIERLVAAYRLPVLDY